MCCESESHHGGGHADIRPCFWTKKEKITWLEAYLEDLQTEAKSIEERIAALKAE